MSRGAAPWPFPAAEAKGRREMPGGAPRETGGDRQEELDPALGLLRICPLCATKTDEFLPFAGEAVKQQRPNAKCPSCGALERHRLAWLYFLNETDLFAGPEPKRMLHVAPEPVLFAKLRSEPLIDYVSADLTPSYAQDEMERMDITDIGYADDTFDAIYCSHVLEHVPDDRKAMRELARVLKPTGWAIILVPILRELTEEDPTVVTAEERSKRFGQFDHVRAYGKDYANRLADAGFAVTVDHYSERIGPTRALRYGLLRGEDVYYLRKAPSAGDRRVEHVA